MMVHKHPLNSTSNVNSKNYQRIQKKKSLSPKRHSSLADRFAERHSDIQFYSNHCIKMVDLRSRGMPSMWRIVRFAIRTIAFDSFEFNAWVPALLDQSNWNCTISEANRFELKMLVWNPLENIVYTSQVTSTSIHLVRKFPLETFQAQVYGFNRSLSSAFEQTPSVKCTF